ncbi:AAA family ATPase [uncultured Dokdonia sp.]|uniref:AAA family ATPase n=1 Tax=uncultured Dokdonia sp. TaxID=575653 RepID=UPI0026045239|nr:AAA family ATPase [uncultured Dokdonia sp.]
MFIKKLTLKNFRCFKTLEIDFKNEIDVDQLQQQSISSDSTSNNRARTLILGENGTGKSNILKAIALVTAGSNALGELLGDVNDWIRYGTDECRIDLEMTIEDGASRHIWLEIHRGDHLGDIMKRSGESLQEIDAALSHTDRNYFIVGYGSSRNAGSGGNNFKSKRSSSQRAQCVASLLDKTAELNSIEEWAIDLDYRSDDGMNIIKKVFDDFLPNTKFHSIDKKERRLLLETKDGIIPFSALSDGYQNMAAWIGDILYRINDIFYDRKEPLHTKGVLLIDEIALHLHPVWQRELLGFIKRTLPNMQLIATTHSPFIAQQAGKDELYTIERIKNDLRLDVFSGDPSGLLLHQILMSDVFGMPTDESLEVENLKKKRATITNRKKQSSKDKEELEDINEKLKDVPIKSYSNSIINKEEHATLKEILKTYKR